MQKTLGPQEVQDFWAKVHAALQMKVTSGFSITFSSPAKLKIYAAMNEEEWIAYDAAWDIPEDDGYITDNELIDINHILNGTVQLDVSHAGGKFQ